MTDSNVVMAVDRGFGWQVSAAVEDFVALNGIINSFINRIKL